MLEVLAAQVAPGWVAVTGLGCELLPGSLDPGTGLRDSVVEPDVAVLAADAYGAVPDEGYLPGAPALAVDVVSTHDRLAKVTWKASRYLLAGAVVVWVLDPKRRRAVVFAQEALPETLPADGVLTISELAPGGGPAPIGTGVPLDALWEDPAPGRG